MWVDLNFSAHIVLGKHSTYGPWYGKTNEQAFLMFYVCIMAYY